MRRWEQAGINLTGARETVMKEAAAEEDGGKAQHRGQKGSLPGRRTEKNYT